MRTNWGQIIWLAVFSIAMGFLEAAVVIYLREIYYPGGFRFPLTVMDADLVLVELMREGATLVMLSGVAVLAGRSFNQRMAFFLAAFSIWDIFYYVFLKLMIGWPDSFFTWDILFLIPVPWIGPVLAPCMVSVTFLVMATVIYYRDSENSRLRFGLIEWIMLVLGSQVVILSWTWDYFAISRMTDGTPKQALAILANYSPHSYLWWMFGVGEVLLILATFLFWRRTR